MGFSSRPQFQKLKGMYHHLLVHLHRETKMNIMVKIQRNSMLHKPSPKVVGLIHVLSVIETTAVDVVMATQVVSSVLKRVTS